MYSATRVNQFEMKDTCFQFVINVWWQGNNLKMKYNLKINLQRLQPCLVLSRHIHNPEKQVIWSVLQNSRRLNTGNYFCKKLPLRCFTGFWIRLWLSSLDTSLLFPLFLPLWINRSSRSQMPIKIKVFKNFVIFTGVIFSYFSEDCTQKKDVLSLSKRNFN